ncbi:MAG TPA: amidohydrolase family protein [Baekduia sp.]|nr:amidohydrolase family protein [Baekduia sp.]
MAQIVLGDIRTLDPAGGRAVVEAMAIGGGRVLAVGTRAEAQAAAPAGTPVHRPDGAVIVPGLIDAHLHLQWAGLKLLRLLGPDDGPIPVADALAALDADAFSVPWPDGEPTLDERLAGLRLIQPVIHALGITGVVDPAVLPAELAAYTECHRRGELTVRVVAMPHPDVSAGADGAIRALDALGVRTGFGDAQLRLGGVKVYFDGVGMGATALRREPWPGREDEPDGRGWQRLPTEDFAAIADYCARERWSLGVHVVGGGGIDAVLGVFAAVDARTPIADRRFTLIHAYLEPSAANLAQARGLGVLVAAQPSIHWSNGAGLVARLGPEAAASNPLRSWIDAGVTVAGGSDGPDFPLDPRLGLWQARTRRVRGDDAPHAPEQALDAAQALALYTTQAAVASLCDDERGMLRPGLLADWTALSVDPVRAGPDAVRTMTIAETAVGGRRVHAHEEDR